MNILLIEDYPTIQKMMVEEITLAGHTVTAATSCAEGIIILKAKPDSFDIVVTDYETPGDKNGRDVIVEANRLGVPSLLMSNNELNAQFTVGINSCRGFFPKMDGLKSLVPAIEQAVQSTNLMKENHS